MKNPSSSLSGALCLPLRFSGSICEQGVLGKVLAVRMNTLDTLAVKLGLLGKIHVVAL